MSEIDLIFVAVFVFESVFIYYVNFLYPHPNFLVHFPFEVPSFIGVFLIFKIVLIF